MATYIQGVTDYIPQIQPFQPDYNFLSNILQTSQSRYDAAHKQLSSVYGTMLNSPMLREENIQKRDEFFKTVDGDIKRISGLDLSLKQNQDQAMQVFKPFYENKDMVKDMAWTKNYYNQINRGEQFKYCTDPDKCGGQFWDGGIKALQYKAQEFKSASKEEAMNFGNVSFTPLVNVMDKSMKAAKDAGFKISYDTVQGGYIVTEKNGQRMVAPLKSFLLSKFGGDPAVMDYYKTQAYIQRKDFITQNANQLGGEDQAALTYMNQTYTTIKENIDKEHERAENNHTKVTNLKQGLAQKIKDKGILPDGKDETLMDMWNSIHAQEAITGQSRDIAKENKDKLDSSKNFSNNSKLMGDHLDQLLGSVMLNKEVGNAAKAFADLTSERDLKADPYSLAAYNSSLDLNKQLKLKDVDFQYWKEKEKLKAAQVKATVDRQFQSTFNGALPGSKGQATGVINENMAKDENQKLLTDLYDGKKASSNEFLLELANELRTQYENTAKNPTKQNALSTTASLIFQGAGIDGKKIAAGDAKELAKLQNLDLVQSSKAYDQALKIVDPVTGGVTGELNKDWNINFWNKTLNQRTAIKDLNKMRGSYVKFLEEQSANVTNAVAGELKASDPVNGKKKADLVNLMAETNHNGFLPEIGVGSTMNNIAHEYADKHQKEYSSWSEAFSFAMLNGKETSDKWYNGYKNHATAFNQADGFGKISNAKMGGGYSYTYDSAVPSNNNTVRLAELLNNAHNIEGAAIVQFGDAGTIKGNDPAAKAAFEQYYTDFMNTNVTYDKNGNPTNIDKNRPKGSYSVQRIGGGDENYMAFSVILDEKYKGQYKGSEKKPGITGAMVPGEPITVFIPKTMANNSYYKDTEYNMYDFMLNKGGGINIDSNPMGGDIKIEKVGRSIQIHGKLLAIDEKGKETYIPVTTTKSDDMDPYILYQTFTQELANLAQFNFNQKELARQNHGIKDPQKIKELMASQGLKLDL